MLRYGQLAAFDRDMISWPGVIMFQEMVLPICSMWMKAVKCLYRLAELSDIELTEQYSDFLDTITSFNINARYDSYKKEFYNLCTQEYTDTWINRIKELRIWIKKML